MSKFEYLTLETENGISVVTINRPKALNALNTQVVKELKVIMTELDSNDEVKVIILTGSGEKAFVAGADIGEMSELTQAEAIEFGNIGNETLHLMEQLSKPVIAAINGFALGGGCELTMACDIRIASEKAKFGQPEVGLGITPGFGGTQRLPRLVGRGMAKKIILSGKNINAEEAYRIGLVDGLASPETLMDEVKELARAIASKSPQAVRLSKKAINEGLDMELEKGTELETKYFGECFSYRDQKEGMAAFLEKRAPKY